MRIDMKIIQLVFIGLTHFSANDLPPTRRWRGFKPRQRGAA